MSNVYLELALNASLLVALSTFYALAGRLRRVSTSFALTLKGLLFGGAAIAGMSLPYEYAPGVIYDARSVVLALAGLFGGGRVALPAASMAGLYRWLLGGAGVWAGLATIGLTAGVGILARKVLDRRNQELRVGHLFLVGWVSHCLMLAAQLLLPRAILVDVLSRVAFPILVIMPLATVLVGVLLLAEEERGKAEKRLEESEERFRLAFDTSLDAIAVNRASDGVYVDVNQGFSRITGYAKEEILGKSSLELGFWARPEDRDRLLGLLERDGEVRNFEAPFRLKDGTIVTGLMSARVFQLRGEPHILTTTREIEQIKQTERRLREALERLEAAQELAGMEFVEWDLTSDTVEASPRLARLLGWRDPSLHSSAELFACVHQDDVEKVREEMARSLREGASCELVFRLRPPVGEVMWVRARGRVVRDLEGRPVRRFLALVDVTDQMKAAETIRLSERRQRLRNQVGQLLLTRPGQGQAGEILSAVLAAVHGETGIFATLRPHDVNQEEWACTTVSTAGDSASRQERTVRLAGRVGNGLWEALAPGLRTRLHSEPLEIRDLGFRAAHVVSVPITGHVGLSGMLVVGRSGEPFSPADVELLASLAEWLSPVLEAEFSALRREQERDLLEAQLRQAQKLEAVGQLAGGVAHDFNNLLSVILGWGEIAIQHLPPGHPGRDALKQILAAANRATALTRQHLVFSRRRPAQTRPLELNELVEGATKMLGRLIGEDISFELQLSRTKLPVVADPGQLEQVLMNLVVNARDAMPAGGRLTIATSRVGRVPGRTAGGEVSERGSAWARLRVEDTGCGMAEEVKERVFEPFFTTKEPGKGTGLGLAVVYSIIQQAGGEIQVTSEPGRGTIFDIYLPLTEIGPESEKPREGIQGKKGRGELILLVEDDPSLRLVAERMMVRAGYRVATAGSGSEAIQLMEAQGLEPDLVVTDVVMPGMSGPALVEYLRKERPNLPFLYISGYPERAAELREGGFPSDVLIPKPFTMEELQTRIARILARGQSRP